MLTQHINNTYPTTTTTTTYLSLRKAATYTQKNTNTVKTLTDIHVLSGIRTHDPSVRACENGSFLRPRGHSDRLYYYYYY
jgi:hypothetical protein